jgi:hypothetical protein
VWQSQKNVCHRTVSDNQSWQCLEKQGDWKVVPDADVTPKDCEYGECQEKWSRRKSRFPSSQIEPDMMGKGQSGGASLSPAAGIAVMVPCIARLAPLLLRQKLNIGFDAA